MTLCCPYLAYLRQTSAVLSQHPLVSVVHFFNMYVSIVNILYTWFYLQGIDVYDVSSPRDYKTMISPWDAYTKQQWHIFIQFYKNLTH